MATFTDYEKWNEPQFIYSSEKEATPQALTRSGIHRIVLNDVDRSITLDFLSRDMESIGPPPSPRYVLVVFSAAVSQKVRTNAAAPFFSGQGLSKSLGLPLLAFSDPSLALDAALMLGWHVGNFRTGDIAKITAKILDRFAAEHNVTFLLTGGSGGGFAALNVGRYMQRPSVFVVNNPQTAIAKYTPQFVEQYVHSAFPDSVAHNGQEDTRTPQELVDTYLSHYSHQVGRINEYPEHHKVFYLQNCFDQPHMQNHVTLFFPVKELSPSGPGVFFSRKKNALLYVGDWGNGHTVFPLPSLIAMLKRVLANASMKEISLSLSEDHTVALKEHLFLFNHIKDENFSVDIELEQVDGRAVIHCIAHQFVNEVWQKLGEKYVSYAFYLTCRGKRIFDRWYRHDRAWSLELNKLPSNFEIRAFVRDSFGVTRQKAKSFTLPFEAP